MSPSPGGSGRDVQNGLVLAAVSAVTRINGDDMMHTHIMPVYYGTVIHHHYYLKSK
jgi:hypothetical protein